ncbi:MAG: spermidine/putrescine ABC transporter substrate-binding protein [Nitrospiraceae bacterium]
MKSLLSRLPTLTALIVVAVLATGCPGGQGDAVDGSGTPVLHYFTWSDYVSQEAIEAFERREHVRVSVDTFSSNEELLAKLQSGASGYDVAVPSDFMVSIMRHLDLLADIDQAEISNVRDLEPHLVGLPFDPAHRFSVPYLWGTVGIGYDSAVIPVAPDSWDILWDKRYAGRISMLNDQREVLGAALRSIGASLNAMDPALLARATRKLVEQKPLVKAYTSDTYDHLLAAGDVVLAHGWGGAVARAARERPSIRYAIPKEGAAIWADCLVVLKGSRHPQLAARFINFLIDEQIAADTSRRLLFAPANRLARALLPTAIQRDPAVVPPLTLLHGLEWMRDLGVAVRLYDRAWTEIKIN